jgi:hypothetical protein
MRARSNGFVDCARKAKKKKCEFSFLDEKKHTKSMAYEKKKEGERLFFYPSFP